MYGKYILSIPLTASNEPVYNTKRTKRIQRQIDSLEIRSSEEQVIKEVKNYLAMLNPYCFPYNDIVGFAEVWIDFNDILINFILNGEGRKVFNRHSGKYRIVASKFYDTIHPVAMGRFYNFNNQEIVEAMSEMLIELNRQCKEWRITFDLNQYDRLLSCLDYMRLIRI